MGLDRLTKAANTAKHWASTHALPLWAARAQREDGSWVEHLSLDGSADLSAERRWRVLARQIYVYAESAKLGWFDGQSVAERTYQQMRETGYVQRVSAGGRATERRRDLYDHAFYLLASASLYRQNGDPQYLEAANGILASLEADFIHPNGGYKETPRGMLPRRQNPHMHVFEASLYLYGETRDAKHLAYAHTIFDLFKAHFFDAKTHTIREYFNEDWSVVDGHEGDTFEPGHSMEWVWLLKRYEDLSGVKTRAYADKLYARATENQPVFLTDERDVSGASRRDTKRLWVQTEVIKGHLAMLDWGINTAAEKAAVVLEKFLSDYLTPNGLWVDQFSANGDPISQTIPVSSMYHILCMMGEACRITNQV